jgi:GH24 family phage-related lysozyme (muramidase)
VGQIASSGRFIALLKDFEGYANWLYLNDQDAVTVGAGLTFPDADSLVRSAIRFRFALHARNAGGDDVRAEFKRIAVAQKGMSAIRYKRIALLRADENHLLGVLRKRIQEAQFSAEMFYNTGPEIANSAFRKFDDLPLNVRYALVDMAFTLGRRQLMKYQELRRLLKMGDWAKAARESHRYGASSKRNQSVYQWISQNEAVKSLS